MDQLIEYKIVNYIKGISNEQENQFIENWLNESEENKQLFNEVSKNINLEERYLLYQSIDTEKAFLQVNKKVKKKKYVKTINLYTKYAALFLLPLTIAFLLIINSKESKQNSSNFSIPAGNKQAILTLETGEKILINNNKIDTINKNENTIYTYNNEISYQLNKESKNEVFHLLTVPRGAENKIILSDGTQVWLNSESELKYPIKFLGKERKIYLKGEAYIIAAKNKEKPLKVFADKNYIKVIGTEFNVRNYKDENKIITTLVEGKVEFCSNLKRTKLKPGEQSILNAKGNIKKKKVNVKEFVSWIDGKYIFKHKRLEEVFHTIERWYDLKIFYQNSQVKDKLITGKLNRSDNLKEFLKLLEEIKIAKFKLTNKTLLIME